MKVRIIGKAKIENGIVKVMKTAPIKALTTFWQNVWTNISLSGSEWSIQQNEPIDTAYFSLLHGNYRLWLFRGLLIYVEDVEPGNGDDDNIRIHIKHLVYRKDKSFSKMIKDVERFERFDQLQTYTRELIPEDVRIFVWRRDNGKCVKCGTNENLEFDHIIPVSKGGSNTERNLQILCSDCNKKKSANI